VNFFLEVADRWSHKILEALQRFPLASLSSFIVTFLLILIIGSSGFANSHFMLLAHKVAFVTSLGIFLFPALHLLSKKLWFKLVGVGLLILYYYLLPLNILDSLIIVRHLLMIFALIFMLFWAPFMDISISNKNIWEWTQNILLIFLATVLLSFAFYAIFWGTMYSIEKLFSLSLEAEHYLQVLVAIIGLFAVNYFLAHLPKYIMLVQKKRYANIGLVFTKYILTPIFLIYFLLLFAYVIKIILEKSWLQADIYEMAVGYTVVAIATYMYWTPLWDEPNRKFRIFLWASLFVLSLLLALSIYVRIEVSTMHLYSLMSLFTFWLMLVSFYFLFFRNASYKWLFFSVSLFIVLSQSEQLINLSTELFDKASLLVQKL
jgi:hypothetical protein